MASEGVKGRVPVKLGLLHNVVIQGLAPFSGWLNYFRVGLSKKLIQELNRWIIRRLRVFLWKQWKLPRTKVRNLKGLGISHNDALKLGNTRKGPWAVSDYMLMNFALPAQWFVKNHGLIRLR
ncbi:hypothetical protein SCARR_05465 [Pontiella sulfatireligans]|uniref:Group II intron maturase-specific domain-containing protein n=2 Tax=Pontiella sulfatireligans TaxID=2750658 RepID=A0A6C2USW3_9BACT|nr:hypothetical protein SCARR_05465 [Pontiella sulfatireligans]